MVTSAVAEFRQLPGYLITGCFDKYFVKIARLNNRCILPVAVRLLPDIEAKTDCQYERWLSSPDLRIKQVGMHRSHRYGINYQHVNREYCRWIYPTENRKRIKGLQPHSLKTSSEEPSLNIMDFRFSFLNIQYRLLRYPLNLHCATPYFLCVTL